MDCLMSFPDFLYAFQTQLFYEGKIEQLIFRSNRSLLQPTPQYYYYYFKQHIYALGDINFKISFCFNVPFLK